MPLIVWQAVSFRTVGKAKTVKKFIGGKLIYGHLITSSCLVCCWLTTEWHLGLASCLLYRNFLFKAAFTLGARARCPSTILETLYSGTKVGTDILGTQCLNTAPFCTGARALVLGHQVWTRPKKQMLFSTLISQKILNTSFITETAHQMSYLESYTWQFISPLGVFGKHLDLTPFTASLLKAKKFHSLVTPS